MWPEDPAGIRPMLASTSEVSLTSAAYAYEPKYDGIRAIIALEPASQPRGGPKESARTRIWSRQGNDKSGQFPDIVAALGKAFAGLTRNVLLDGEIVAVDDSGAPTTFLRLQGRMHRVAAHDRPGASVAFIVFDILVEGGRDLRQSPLAERRAHLERVMHGRTAATVRLSEHVVGDGRPLQRRAHDDNWEGLIAKRLESRYVSGKRSTDWCKVKLVRHQTCVIGGWTLPKGVRQRFGALLLGVYDEQGQLQHAGQVGTGFSSAELEHVWHLLTPLSTERAPFVEVPRQLARARWVKPELVCEVKFAEWTLDGKLRHPAYLGMRDDVAARRVRKEPQTGTAAKARTLAKPPGRMRARTRLASFDLSRAYAQVIAQVDAIQAGSGSGRLELPDGDVLDATNLGKVFWPQLKLTKGDLFRHYLRVGAAILPVLADRPLVMKRYPSGVDAKPFYQHRAADRLPEGVVVANVESNDGPRPHVIGGSLVSLLYTSQLAAISQDPWFSRLRGLDHMDAIAIDLDPPDGLPFRRVLDIALRVRDELAALGAEAFAKTSGARGVHVFVPMPTGTPYAAGLLYARIVTTMVARKHPQHATVERTVAARGQRIYLDSLQNMRGKTLASAYSVRANAWAGVSTPLRWDEVEAGVSATDFTLETIGARLDAVGDIWAGLRETTPADLRAVMRYAEP